MVSDRARAVPPLLAAEQDTRHGPTRALFDALRENSWGVKWRSGGTAMLVHPRFGTLEVQVDETDTDRVIPFVEGRQVSMRVAMERARGEV
jgi:prophage DNA circulation protein